MYISHTSEQLVLVDLYNILKRASNTTITKEKDYKSSFK